MSRSVWSAAGAWVVAIAAAIAGVLMPGRYVRASLALFAFAVALALLVPGLLIVGGVRARRARTPSTVQAARASLARLEYLPTVTTGARRIYWRGSRVGSIWPRVSQIAPSAESGSLEHTSSDVQARDGAGTVWAGQGADSVVSGEHADSAGAGERTDSAERDRADDHRREDADQHVIGETASRDPDNIGPAAIVFEPPTELLGSPAERGIPAR